MSRNSNFEVNEPLLSRANQRWTDEEQRYLQHTNGRIPREQQALYLGRTVEAVKVKVRELDLPPIEDVWEDWELRVLGLFCDLSIEEMSHQLQRSASEILTKLRDMYPVKKRRELFYQELYKKIEVFTLDGVNKQVLRKIKDRARTIGKQWCQHPKFVNLRLRSYGIMIKAILTEAYNQITKTDDIPFPDDGMMIYQRRYRLQYHLYGGAKE